MRNFRDQCITGVLNLHFSKQAINEKPETDLPKVNTKAMRDLGGPDRFRCVLDRIYQKNVRGRNPQLECGFG